MQIHGLRDSFLIGKFHVCCKDMQKVREKQTILVVVLRAEAVYNSFQSQKNILDLRSTCNFRFKATKKCFSILLPSILRLFIKISCMDGEQAAFE